MNHLLHELIRHQAEQRPDAVALTFQGTHTNYGDLSKAVAGFQGALLQRGIEKSDRIAIWLEKRTEMVVACFGTAAAGSVFVPVNPVLKAEQVAYILRDCNARLIVTSHERWRALSSVVEHCPDLRGAIIVGSTSESLPPSRIPAWCWNEAVDSSANVTPHRVIDTDMVAILYTSGSTGRPKGVVLSHRNMVAGAYSVAHYIGNVPSDKILSALPLSFDAGFSQLTTAFRAGASVVLLNYLLPRDVVSTCEREGITGLTAVPPLWIQLAQIQWPENARRSMRYFANTGGRMPRSTLEALRRALPNARPYLMYGLTEAFRSTFLPPEEVDRRPDSIGKAIPNAEIMVVREDGAPCAPGEPGELVHRGALVSLGYWNDPEKTAERFRPAPGRPSGLVMPEIAVWSGDTVRTDEDGFLYFIGRRDEMIKTSGYRVSPTEIEEVIYATGIVGEAAAFGIAHPTLDQAIVVVVAPRADATVDIDALRAELKTRLPAYMVPAHLEVSAKALPRNPNGKIDRRSLADARADLFGGAPL